MVKLSASELDKMSKDTKARYNDLVTVINQIESAVSGRDWQSQAASSFAERWGRDKEMLKRLRDDLARWSETLRKHHDIAVQLNKPFR